MSEAPDVMWPEVLRPHVYEEQLQLRSCGPHPYTWCAVPFGLFMIAMGSAQIVGLTGVDRGFAASVAATIALMFGGAALYSSAYSAWGRVTLHRREQSWVITRRLWRWSREAVVPWSDIRWVEIKTEPSAIMLFPGFAGKQVNIQLSRQKRTVFVGGGFCLPLEILEAVNDMLRKSCGLA